METPDRRRLRSTSFIVSIEHISSSAFFVDFEQVNGGLAISILSQ